MTTITYRHGHKQGPSLAWTSPTGLDRLGWKRKQRATVLSSPPKPVELEISTPQAILNINKLKKKLATVRKRPPDPGTFPDRTQQSWL
jgi:hypothetical protein